MELNTQEMQAARDVEHEIREQTIRELLDLHLAVVGGGIGDIVGA